MQKLTTDQFIAKALDLHGNTYDYSKVQYISSTDKIVITCPEHGDFTQIPNNHLKKSGCPKCGISKRIKGGKQ